MLQSDSNQLTETKPAEKDWRGLYKLGAFTALILIVLPPAEIIISLLPGAERASASTATVVDWFSLFHDNWFLGLRNLGSLNLVAAALLIPTILAVYFALRRSNEAFGALGAILFFMGIAVYIASSRAFPMLSLSRQYAAATTDAQRSLFTAAGQALLAEGQSRSGLLLIEFACLLISAVMLRSRIFSKATAWAGMLGNALLMVVEIAFTPVSSSPAVVVAACGGLSVMTWYLLVARRLFRLATA
ncbi:MAG: DUF4386 family protein [Candidatus Acidiferrum sp.]